jgi:hypothetical protein
MYLCKEYVSRVCTALYWQKLPELTCRHIYTHVYTQQHIHVCQNTHNVPAKDLLLQIDKGIHTSMRTYIYTYIHMQQSRTRCFRSTRAYTLNAHIHTCKHTHTHTYTRNSHRPAASDRQRIWPDKPCICALQQTRYYIYIDNVHVCKHMNTHIKLHMEQISVEIHAQCCKPDVFKNLGWSNCICSAYEIFFSLFHTCICPWKFMRICVRVRAYVLSMFPLQAMRLFLGIHKFY